MFGIQIRPNLSASGRLRRQAVDIIVGLVVLVVIVGTGPGLFGVAARNWGYIALNRSSPGPAYALGRCGPMSRDLRKADVALTFALGLRSNDARTESALSIVRLCSGDLTAATELLQDAHRSAPGDPVIEVRLGAAKLLTGDADGAVVNWNDAGASPTATDR